MKEKILPIVVKGNSPRIGDTELRVADDCLALRTVSEKSAIGSALRTKYRLHIAVKKHAFTHDKGTGRIGAER